MQRSYPPRLVEFVRRLGQQNYRIVEAQAALRKLGVDPLPSRSTIKRWLDPDAWEAHRMSQRPAKLPGPQPRVRWTWQRKLERLRELHTIGLSYRAVALVMNHDYTLRLTENSVRRLVTTGRPYPVDSIKRLMAGYELRSGRRPVASDQNGRQHQRQARPEIQADA